jgi:predicted enzyme related to lactoylglutathione lyase
MVPTAPRPTEVIMPNPIVHAEIRSNDPDATRAFFGGLFGWTYPVGAIPGYTYVDSGVPNALPAGIGPVQGGNELVTFFVGVDDIEAAVTEAQRLGGAVVQPVVRVPGVAFALIADPVGQVVGLAQQG